MTKRRFVYRDTRADIEAGDEVFVEGIESEVYRVKSAGGKDGGATRYNPNLVVESLRDGSRLQVAAFRLRRAQPSIVANDNSPKGA